MPSDSQVAAKLQGTLRALGAAETVPATIDLVAIAAFDWDRLYIFGAYQDQAAIERLLGFHCENCDTIVPFVEDRLQLLVFFKERSVVRWFSHEKVSAEFVDENKPIERRDARAVRVSFPRW
jgi:hypothetical protein